MPDQRYQQYCALARTLDVAGDRWTLLIVRELAPGPRRFTDLVNGLPGISRKLLTDRLRSLEDAGVLERRELPPPAARQIYQLTDDGRDLAVAMAPLIAWGSRRLGERGSGESFHSRWPAVGMVGLANREAAKGVRETFQFLVGDSAFHFKVDNGSIELHDGEIDDAAIVVNTDDATWAEVASGRVGFTDAVEAGTVTVAGDRQAQKRFGRIFSREHMLAGSPVAGS